jgi:hypothetical protein
MNRLVIGMMLIAIIKHKKLLLMLLFIALVMPMLGASTETEAQEFNKEKIADIQVQDAAAAVSSMISYQGTLLDSNGNPVNGTTNMTFSLYNVSTGGSSLWSETKNVQVSNGMFNTQLGDVHPLNVAQFDQALWLEMVVGNETLTPRIQLLGAPYAFSLVPGAKITTTERVQDALTVDNSGSNYINCFNLSKLYFN